MYSYPDRLGRLHRSARIALLGGILAVELAIAPPSEAGRADEPDLRAAAAEFGRICDELNAARGGLRAGTIGDDEFAERVLELFVRADSLGQKVPRGGWIQAGRNSGSFALSRALRYLIESLRENYVGIAARNGVSFVEADRAYQAAVAWRSDIEAATASAAR
jgi:hypothetical protein